MEKLVVEEKVSLDQESKEVKQYFTPYLNKGSKPEEFDAAARYMNTINNPNIYWQEKRNICAKLAADIECIYKEENYCEFPDASYVQQQIIDDLYEFNNYANFTDESITAS